MQKLLYFVYSLGRQFRLVDRSGLFDENFYIEQYPNVVRDNKNPLTHYFSKGVKEGNYPNPLFDTSYYVENNPEISGSRINPLAHYIEIGSKQGKDPHPLFDTSYYYEQCPEAKTSGMNALSYYFEKNDKIVSAQPLFDPVFYKKQNPDVVQTGVDPLIHYIWYGANENRDPNPLFDASYYMKNDPELAESGINPLEHYIEIGSKQGKDPHPLFDTSYYYEQYPEVKTSGMSALTHYFKSDEKNVSPHPLFDTVFYKEQNPDVVQAGVDPLIHYIWHGAKEYRYPNPLFDTSYYVENNPELTESGINPLEHYMEIGSKQGKDPHPLFNTQFYYDQFTDSDLSETNALVHYFDKNDPVVSPHPLFDPVFYIKQNPEDTNANITPFIHFLKIGAKERKDPHPLFDMAYYMAHYPDVTQAGINPLHHFMKVGGGEERVPHPLFDTAYYINQNPDVVASGMNPLVHYIQQGAVQGKNPHPLFDTTYYMVDNPDVTQTGMNPLVHYSLFGAREGRIPFRTTERLSDIPMISIISAIIRFDKDLIYEGLRSIFNQKLKNCQLCLAVDTKFRDMLKIALKELKINNQRVKIKWIDQGDCETDIINEAIMAASGEFLAFFDLFDELTPNGLIEVARLLNKSTDADLIYPDEDKVTRKGNYVSPFFKPDWSLELFRQTRYIGRFFIVRKTIVENAGFLDRKYNGFHYDEIILRISELTKKIHHIDKILYHRRKFSHDRKSISKIDKRGVEIWEKAVNMHFNRIELPAYALRDSRFDQKYIKIYPKQRNTHPLVSVIVFTEKNDSTLQHSILDMFQETEYPNFEVILVDRTGTKEEASFNSKYRFKIKNFKNFGALSLALNHAANVADGGYLIFIENEFRITNKKWIQDILFYAEQPNIGVVGNPIKYMELYNEVITNQQQYQKKIELHRSRLLNSETDNHYCVLNKYAREGSAVSKNLMVIKALLFKSVGGFVPSYKDTFFDFDLCFRIRGKGFRVIQLVKDWIPHVDNICPDRQFYKEDRLLFLDQWQDIIEQGDPYYKHSYLPLYDSPLAKLVKH